MVNRTPANTNMYALMIHWSPDAEAFNSRWSVGMATFKTVMSSPMIINAIERIPRVHFLFA